MSDTDNTLKIKIEVDGDLTPGAQKAQDALDQANKTIVKTADDAKESARVEVDSTEKVEIGKRELLESMHRLNREYPLLGEAARAAFNPLAITIAGLVEAGSIWVERLKAAQEVLGGFELPDFSAHTSGVSAAAEAYDKLKTAVQGADEEFNGAAAAFERQSTAIKAQLDATKQLIAAQKEKALADLDIERAGGRVSAGSYDARRSMIEQGANDATVQAEIDARNADMAARKQEAAQIEKDSQAAAAKAANIQPGLNDASLKQLIAEAQAGVEASKKAEADAKAEASHAEDVEVRVQGGQGLTGLADIAQNAAGDVGFFAKHGLTANPEEVAKQESAAAKAAQETQAGLEDKIAQLQKQLDERTKARDEAARLAAEAEKKRLELQGQDNPNQVGSVAWQNAQAQKTQGLRDTTSEEKRFAADVEQFTKDAATYKHSAGKADPESIAKARQAMTDMFEMVTDAFSIMQQLAGMGQNVAELRARVGEMERSLGINDSQISNANNWHASG
jgi:hypothetical protein